MFRWGAPAEPGVAKRHNDASMRSLARTVQTETKVERNWYVHDGWGYTDQNATPKKRNKI